MPTITATWIPSNGSTYEVWYAKQSVVGTTTVPPSTGWTQAPGSPFDSSLGTASITGVDDNTIYVTAIRNDCGDTSDSAWTTNTIAKLDCPTLSLVANPINTGDTGASITANLTISNPVELGSLTGVLNLQIIQTGASSGAIFHALSQPFATSMSYTFSNLLTGTSYDVGVLMNNTLNGGAVVFCNPQTITTQTPVVVPPPTCATPTFTLTNITATGVTINFNDTDPIQYWGVSLDGGVTYPIDGIPSTQTSYTFSNLTVNTQYKVIVRALCVSSATSVSTSQTFTTTTQTVQGYMQVISNINATTANSGTLGNMSIQFTFPQPTPVPLTIYVGFIFGVPVSQSICSSYGGYYAQGVSIFTPPAGYCYTGSMPGLDHSGNGNSPLVISIPQGVTSYNASSIYTQYAVSGTCIGCTNEAFYNQSIRAFIGSGIPNGVVHGLTEVFVKVNSPSGYQAAFRLQPYANLPLLVLQNV